MFRNLDDIVPSIGEMNWLDQEGEVADIDDAARRNEILASRLGWNEHFAGILDLLGLPAATNTGDFARAVSQWQAVHGLEADGIIGPATWGAMTGALGISGSEGSDQPTKWIQGVDISHHQGKVDISRIVVEGGMRFVIVKGTEGADHLDRRFEDNWKQLIALDPRQATRTQCVRGAYHFARPAKNPGRGGSEREARWFCAALKRAQYYGEGCLPPILDWETSTPASSPKEDVEWIRGWIHVVQSELGRKPMIYTGPNTWKHTTDDSTEFLDYPLWVVKYSSSLTRPPRMPLDTNKPEWTWAFWQWSGGGKVRHYGNVPGVPSGVADINRFNGTERQLRALAALERSRPPGGDNSDVGNIPGPAIRRPLEGQPLPAAERPGGGPIKDKRDPASKDLESVAGYNWREQRAMKVKVHRLAATALSLLRAAAREAGFQEPLFLPISGYRDTATQQKLWAKALNKYGSAEKARKWVAPPGKSAHHSGRALDLWLGFAPDSKRVDDIRRTPQWQWMRSNAQRFGFYPYEKEPWHWEYNPPSQGDSEMLGELGC